MRRFGREPRTPLSCDRRLIAHAVAFLATLCLAHGADAAPDGTRVMQIAGATVRLQFDEPGFQGTEPIVGWIDRSMKTVAGYYGRFPVSPVRIRVALVEGDTVRFGQAFGGPAPFVRLDVGREVTAEALTNDWIAVHEMVHLALPGVGRRHAWLAEGLATYVEGIARVQAGERDAQGVWSELARAMPQGLPHDGDEGLDNTHTWGRTYWGGALFCLQADVEIRTRTQNRFGLQDALRAVLQASGGIVTDWPIDRVMQTGDAAVGTTVLSELYARMKDAPVAPDLAALWQQLGVERGSRTLRADAPLAATRRAIMPEPPMSAAPITR